MSQQKMKMTHYAVVVGIADRACPDLEDLK